MSTAFAAQVLANAGFVVLQIAEASRAITLDSHEGSLVAEGYRSAIERLIFRRIVDEKRVGLIAFSRTGYHAISLLAESPQLLTAIAIADSVQPGYVQDMLAVNDTEVASQIHALNGSSPHEGGYGPWFDTNPMYKLRSTRSAVRIEAIGPVSLTAMWETFAVLRRTDRAVDLIYFPHGSHVLTKPIERVGSQGGTVDWFRFWLQGYEDPDASKTAGYVRWRKLRTMREEQQAAASD